MKNITTVTRHFVINNNDYHVMTFTPENDNERKFGEKPWIAVHSSYKETDLPLNGLQMLLSKDFAQLKERMWSDSLIRNYKRDNPNYKQSDLIKFICDIYKIEPAGV